MNIIYNANYINPKDVKPGGMYFCPVSKEEAVKCDLRRMIKNFENMRETGRTGKGTLVISFDGYDNDPREIYQIPECKEFMIKLLAAIPYMFYYLLFDPSVLFPLVLCLSHSEFGIEVSLVQIIDKATEEFANSIDDNNFPSLKKLILNKR
ncbi:hypothetical protein [Holdemania massiliensis]|uniref:hypothetical protein n=1 Tax=Holdemania massiliensis TaxID=1468449 RepID=UPI00242BB046|nr:hypothetical protein [Holdemania massiliensis]